MVVRRLCGSAQCRAIQTYNTSSHVGPLTPIFLEAYPTRRFQSAWMGIIVHSLQSAFVIIVVFVLVVK